MDQSMESSESPDDSFGARVQKAFGPLSSSQSPWSLTDDEIEKREWNRDRGGGGRDDDLTPCSSSFDGLSFPKDRKKFRPELGNNGVDDDGERGDGDDDEWEIRSSIGMDCTLDNEEEEDEFDKVAVGRDNASDVLYMRDVNDHGPYLNYNVISCSVGSVGDPRANHLAAKVRLEEDEVEAQKIAHNFGFDKPSPKFEEHSIKASGAGGKPKSILKRKNDGATTSKEQKRVKFDSGCKDDFEAAAENPHDLLRGTHLAGTTISDDNPSLGITTSGVPDYARNPSKYTHYTFDSASEVDDESNNRVCMDFLKLSKPEESSSLLGDASSRLPKSVTFIPRKKAAGDTPRDSSSEIKQNQEDGSEQSVIQTSFPLGVAEDDLENGEVGGMEDELESGAADTNARVKKQCRNYRTRSKLDDTVT